MKKTATQVAAASGNLTIGVRLSSINRELDQYLQRQLRTETSGGAYATHARGLLPAPAGRVRAAGRRATRSRRVFNDFTSAAQALVDLAGLERRALWRADRRARRWRSISTA